MQIQTKSTASNKITCWKGIAAFLSLMGIAFSPLKTKRAKQSGYLHGKANHWK
jgi:hypothetical protein